ncbi:hypothetical protein phiK7A1_163 [Pseudomonas phage phiK7A1]|uniref:Uncharacterized protein n=1 Tax=Pseudomonas phage phiK7A1 TaxID=2759194 RepID=A0A7H0XG11_9CAUD|nr:hypothetical protein phiK7A1_163 [Pseudomonas phage phiK7A1]
MTNRTRIYVKVIVEDSRYNFSTAFNATFEEACDYYMNQTFNFGVDTDLMLKCVAVELIPTVE